MNVAPQPPRDPSPDTPADKAFAPIELSEQVLAGVDAALASRDGAGDDKAGQRDAEIRLLELMRADDFTGPRFERMFAMMASELIGYAFPVIRHWVVGGQIFVECLRFRRPIIAQARDAASAWTLEQKEAFTADAIIGTDATLGGVGFFLEYGLKKGNWDPQKGACAATYFVGACACCFTTLINKWWKEKVVADAMLTSPAAADDEDEDELLQIPEPSYNPEQLVVARDSANRAMAQVKDPKVQEVLLRRSFGETQADAARAVGLSEKAAERRLHTHRQQMRRDDAEGWS